MSKASLRIYLALLVSLSVLTSASALEISGVVQDPGLNPVPGASVWLLQNYQVKQQTTDAKGAFAFRDLEVAGAELVAWKEGWSLGGYFGTLYQSTQVPVVLRPAASVQLRILNNSFSPVPGATVDRMLVNDTIMVSVRELAKAGFPLIRGDDQGMLTISNLPVRGFVKLAVNHPDYAESTVAYLPVREEREEIVLLPGIKLRGRVVANEKGVAGAHVIVAQKGMEGSRLSAEIETDPEGYFSVRLPQAAGDTQAQGLVKVEGVYTVSARHPDYASTAPREVKLEGDTEPSVEIALVKPLVVKGSIVGPESKSAAGVRVLFRDGDVVLDETLSDEQGRYQLKSPAAKGTLTVVAPQGMMTEAHPDLAVDMGRKKEVKIEPLRLVKLPEVEGRVLDDRGAPVAKAVITSRDSLLPEEKRKDLPPWAGRLFIDALTDEEGRFRIRLGEAPPNKKLTLRAQHPLHFLGKTAEVDFGRHKPVEFRLTPYAPDLEERTVGASEKELADLRGKPAPALETSDWFNSSALTLEALKGKVVVLHFWAGFDDSITGLARLREVMALHEALEGVDDVVFIGIHDASSTADEIEDFVHRFGITFPVARDADPYKSFTTYGIVYLPQTVILDKEGILRHYQVEGRLLELILALRR